MRRADRPFIAIDKDTFTGVSHGDYISPAIGAGKTHAMKVNSTPIKKDIFSEALEKRFIKVNATPEMIIELQKLDDNRTGNPFAHTHDMFTYCLGNWINSDQLAVPSVYEIKKGEVILESSINKDAVKLPSMFEVIVKFQNRGIEFETWTSKSGRKNIEVKEEKGSITRSFELFPNMTESQFVKELLYKISGLDGLARRDYIEYYGEDDLSQRLTL